MALGRILQFDSARGYGFVAADDDGGDVFLHASVFDDDPSLLVPGTRLRFQVMAGDRGRKAFAAELVADGLEDGAEQALPISALPRMPAGPPGQATPAPAPPPRPGSPSAGAAAPADFADPDEEVCDVLSAPQFTQEVTELLLGTVPELTGQNVNQARQALLDVAKKHGWIDG